MRFTERFSASVCAPDPNVKNQCLLKPVLLNSYTAYNIASTICIAIAPYKLLKFLCLSYLNERTQTGLFLTGWNHFPLTPHWFHWWQSRTLSLIGWTQFFDWADWSRVHSLLSTDSHRHFALRCNNQSLISITQLAWWVGQVAWISYCLESHLPSHLDTSLSLALLPRGISLYTLLLHLIHEHGTKMQPFNVDDEKR